MLKGPSLMSMRFFWLWIKDCFKISMPFSPTMRCPLLPLLLNLFGLWIHFDHENVAGMKLFDLRGKIFNVHLLFLEHMLVRAESRCQVKNLNTPILPSSEKAYARPMERTQRDAWSMPSLAAIWAVVSDIILDKQPTAGFLSFPLQLPFDYNSMADSR